LIGLFHFFAKTISFHFSLFARLFSFLCQSYVISFFIVFPGLFHFFARAMSFYFSLFFQAYFFSFFRAIYLVLMASNYNINTIFGFIYMLKIQLHHYVASNANKYKYMRPGAVKPWQKNKHP